MSTFTYWGQSSKYRNTNNTSNNDNINNINNNIRTYSAMV